MERGSDPIRLVSSAVTDSVGAEGMNLTPEVRSNLSDDISSCSLAPNSCIQAGRR